MMLPLVGGFNDGKYIEPNGRKILKMAKPSDYPNLPGVVGERHNSIANFDYEIYNLASFNIGRKSINFFMAEGLSVEDAAEKIVYGYKQFIKKKKA